MNISCLGNVVSLLRLGFSNKANSNHDQKNLFYQFLLLIFSLAASIIILPFAVIRLLNQEWLIAAVDLTASLLFASVFVQVFFLKKIKSAEAVLSVLFLVAAITSIIVVGPHQAPVLYPAMLGAFFLLGKEKGVLANLVASLVVVITVWNNMSSISLLMYVSSMVVTILFAFAFSYQTDRQQKQLIALAQNDPLTGALNRRAFNDHLESVLERQQRDLGSPSLIIIDLDKFKSINDELGHQAGDQVLIKVTELILSRLRKTDRLFRIGGEEFAILPFEPLQNFPSKIAEGIRKVIESNQILTERKVTVSIGVANYRTHETQSQWFKRADEALYSAKRSGRNRVCDDSKY